MVGCGGFRPKAVPRTPATWRTDKPPGGRVSGGEPVTEQGATHRARPQLCEDGRGAAAPLVHLPQSSAAFLEVLDEKTGEIQRFSVSAKRREYVQFFDEKTAISDARARRFALLGCT